VKEPGQSLGKQLDGTERKSFSETGIKGLGCDLVRAGRLGGCLLSFASG